MGAKDIKAKEYLSDNCRFADLCNYYLFRGENVIRPENLVTQDTTELMSVFGTTDYKLNLIIPEEITDFDKFKTSLGAVLEVIKFSKDEKAMGELITTKPIFKDLELEAVKTINMFAKLNLEINQKEDKNMDLCKAWADHKESGIKEGELLKLIELVMKKMKKGNTPEQIAEMLEESPETVKNICNYIEQESLEGDAKKICHAILQQQ